MRKLPPLKSAEDVGELLTRLNAAVAELQGLAITNVNGAVTLHEGTLSLIKPADVLVKNTTTSDCGLTDILGISGSAIDPSGGDGPKNDFEQRVVLTGVSPVVPDHLGKFVVCAEPIPAGGIGRCWAAGVCPCLVVVGNTSDGNAEISSGDSIELASGTSGSAQILWKESGTGQQWAVVRLLGPPVTATAGRATGSPSTLVAGTDVQVAMTDEKTSATVQVLVRQKTGQVQIDPSATLEVIYEDCGDGVDGSGNKLYRATEILSPLIANYAE